MRLRTPVFVTIGFALFLGFATAQGSPASTQARKFAFIFGAGGEPPGAKTIFDVSFDQMGKVLTQAGYAGRLAYNGGHADAEGLSEKHFPGQRTEVMRDEIEKAIRDFEKDIEEGRIKAGDQLLIVNLNHGFLPEKKTKSHPVASRGGDFNMDGLESLRLKAEKAGVKLAILDQSCYGGASLALASPKTCVISATGADNVGYTTEIYELWKRAAPGKSLESVFLEARKYGYMPTSPRISGEAGTRVEELLKTIQKHLLNYSTDIEQKLRKSQDCPTCFTAEKAGVETELQLNLAEIAALAAIPKATLDEIKKRIQEHARIFQALEADWKLEREFAKKMIKIGPTTWSWATLSRFDLAAEKKHWSELVASAKAPFPKTYYQHVLASLDQVQAKRDQLPQDKDFASFLSLRSKVDAHSKDLAQAAAEVGKLERALYDVLYQAVRGKGANPCAGFVL